MGWIMAIDFLQGLKADDIFGLRERLETASKLAGDPRVRQVPPGMYLDIAQSLYFLELAVRQSHENMKN